MGKVVDIVYPYIRGRISGVIMPQGVLGTCETSAISAV